MVYQGVVPLGGAGGEVRDHVLLVGAHAVGAVERPRLGRQRLVVLEQQQPRRAGGVREITALAGTENLGDVGGHAGTPPS